MLPLVIILVAELILLFLLSERLTKSLYAIFYSLFHHHMTAAGLLTFLYLPGTAIHELSHLVVAEILRVPTGELSFTPEVVRHETGQREIKAGYLKVAETDPLRRFLIGIAPLLFGLIFTFTIVWLFQYFWPQLDTTLEQAGVIILTGYLLFAVSNNMFSSRADLEGSQYFLPVVMLVVLVLYLMGVRIILTDQLLEVFVNALTGLTRALGIVCGVNLLLLVVYNLFLRAIRR